MSFVERLKEADVKIAFFDIETKPVLGYTWGLFKQYLSLDQIVDPGGLLSFAYKILGEEETVFVSEWTHGYDNMVREAHRFFNSVDVVIGYNSDRFDIRKLNSYFIEAGLEKPKPYKSIDLFKESKKNFAFPSGKLDYLAQRTVNDKKTPHQGFKMWLDVMAGDKEAQKLFQEYNVQDVQLLEHLYLSHLSWWSSTFNMSMLMEIEDGCPRCGSQDMQELVGSKVYTAQQTYTLFQCQECKTYSRNTIRLQEPNKFRRVVG